MLCSRVGIYSWAWKRCQWFLWSDTDLVMLIFTILVLLFYLFYCKLLNQFLYLKYLFKLDLIAEPVEKSWPHSNCLKFGLTLPAIPLKLALKYLLTHHLEKESSFYLLPFLGVAQQCELLNFILNWYSISCMCRYQIFRFDKSKSDNGKKLHDFTGDVLCFSHSVIPFDVLVEHNGMR